MSPSRWSPASAVVRAGASPSRPRGWFRTSSKRPPGSPKKPTANRRWPTSGLEWAALQWSRHFTL
eukprot:10888570-Alexandrium_andersonii.AAC.1